MQYAINKKLVENHQLVVDESLKRVLTDYYGSDWTVEQLKADRVEVHSRSEGDSRRYSVWRDTELLAAFLVCVDWSDTARVTVQSQIVM